MNRTKAIKEFYLRRALCKSPAEVQHATALSKFQIAYWKRKVVDEDFHPQSWGGKRYSKFNNATQHVIEALMGSLSKKSNPTNPRILLFSVSTFRCSNITIMA